jgi:hypothetical protein
VGLIVKDFAMTGRVPLHRRHRLPAEIIAKAMSLNGVAQAILPSRVRGSAADLS